MPHRKQAKKCFSCRSADVHYSRASLRIYIVCSNQQCFDKQFNLKPETVEG